MTAAQEHVEEAIVDQFEQLLSIIQDDSVRAMLQEDVTAITKLKQSLQSLVALWNEIQSNVECFDREDAVQVQRMLRVLEKERQWRIRRLSIAIQEYDNKILKMINILKHRHQALERHAVLESDNLLEPLHGYFVDKGRQLET